MNRQFKTRVKRHVYHQLLRNLWFVLILCRPSSWWKEWAGIADTILYVNRGYIQQGWPFRFLMRCERIRLRFQECEDANEAYCHEMMQYMY